MSSTFNGPVEKSVLYNKYRRSYTWKEESMWRVYISRCINFYLFGGKKNQMLSSRAFIFDKKKTELIINLLFLDRNHCRKAYIWERRNMEEDECIQCKIPIDPGEGIYVMGFHRYACSQTCNQIMLDSLTDNRQLDLPLAEVPLNFDK